MISFLVPLWLLHTMLVIGKKPNILFLNVDEMEGRVMDPTAPDQYNAVFMPNLRSMASQGTQFIRHYTNGPQCVCGRSVLWTGRRTHDIHVFNNAFGIAAFSNGTVDKSCAQNYDEQFCLDMFNNKQKANYTILDAMKSFGYQVYVYGKLHIGAGIMDLPSQKNATNEAFETATDSNSMSSITRSANINKPTESNPVKTYNDNVTNPHADDEAIIGKCLERLNNLGNKRVNNSDTDPFMLYCSVDIPHPAYQTNSTWLKYVDINNITIPTNLNESKYNGADRYASSIDDTWHADWTDEQIIGFRKTYYGLNAQTDYMLGEVMDALFANGFSLNDTYIIFTSDHGEMNLDHRQAGKNSMYEGATRIPLFIAGPNVESQRIITNLTEMVDILPTLIDIGSGNTIDDDHDQTLQNLAGVSLLPFTNENNSNNNHPKYVTSQYHSLKANTGVFMVRKDEWKYIQYGHYLNAYKNYSAQLFDLNKDPNEVNDVSKDNPEIVNELENLLVERYNYEYIDCVAKQQDVYMFNTHVWDKYNSTKVYHFLSQTYGGFNQTDWQKIVEWRTEIMNAPNCTTLVH